LNLNGNCRLRTACPEVLVWDIYYTFGADLVFVEMSHKFIDVHVELLTLLFHITTHTHQEIV